MKRTLTALGIHLIAITMIALPMLSGSVYAAADSGNIYCDNGANFQCINLRNGSCSPGTVVQGWPIEDKDNNEYITAVQIVGGSAPIQELRFSECGTTSPKCVFDDSGKLALGSCTTATDSDLWYNYENDTYSWYKNPNDGNDILAWNTKGLQMVTHGWDGGNSEWVQFSGP